MKYFSPSSLYYPEILNVEPEMGSVGGGTTITVSTSVDVSSYRPEEVQVYVGGETRLEREGLELARNIRHRGTR